MSGQNVISGRTRLTHEVHSRAYGDKAAFFDEMARVGRLAEFVDETRIERLIAASDNLDEIDYLGDTALTLAINEGDRKAVERLLDAGASVTQPNSRGRTPLMCALQKRDWHIAEQLISLGGLNDARDNLGRTHINYYMLADRSLWSRTPKAVKRAFSKARAEKRASNTLFSTSPAICAAVVINQYAKQKHNQRNLLTKALSTLLPGMNLTFALFRVISKIPKRIRLLVTTIFVSMMIAALTAEHGYYEFTILGGAVLGFVGFVLFVLLKDSWIEDSFACAAKVRLKPRQAQKGLPNPVHQRSSEHISASLRFGARDLQNQIERDDPNWRKVRHRILAFRLLLRTTWLLQFPVQIAFVFFGVLSFLGFTYMESDEQMQAAALLMVSIFFLVLHWLIQSWRRATIQDLPNQLTSYVAESRSEHARRWRDGQERKRPRGDEDYLVYLRPFDIDAGDSVCEQSLEALMVDALRTHGPVLSLGSDEQGFGASRIQTTDQSWKEDAEQLLAQSAGIIMIPHFSAGVVWEMQELRRRGWLDRTVFVMPPSWSFTKSYDQSSWQKTQQVLGEHGFELPDYVSAGAVFELNSDAAIDAHAPFGLEPTPWHIVLGLKLPELEYASDELDDAMLMLMHLQYDHPLESDGDYGIDFELLNADGGFELELGGPEIEDVSFDV